MPKSKTKWSRPDLRYHYGIFKDTGLPNYEKKIYDIKASRLSKAAFKTLVKQANERLRQIEKRGLQSVSREYQWVKYYAEEYEKSKGAIYNVNPKTGAIRFSSDLNKFMNEGKMKGSASDRRAYMINTLRNFLTAESSTIGGIKKQRQKAFETFKENIKIDGHPDMADLTREQYDNFWKIYRETLAESKMMYSYDKVVRLLDSNIMVLPTEQIQEIMNFQTTTDQDTEDFVELAEDMFPNLKFTF